MDFSWPMIFQFWDNEDRAAGDNQPGRGIGLVWIIEFGLFCWTYKRNNILWIKLLKNIVIFNSNKLDTIYFIGLSDKTSSEKEKERNGTLYINLNKICYRLTKNNYKEMKFSRYQFSFRKKN